MVNEWGGVVYTFNFGGDATDSSQRLREVGELGDRNEKLGECVPGPRPHYRAGGGGDDCDPGDRDVAFDVVGERVGTFDAAGEPAE